MRLFLASFVLLLLALAPARSAYATAADPRLLARLNDDQRRSYVTWRMARTDYDRQHDAYWATVVARRTERRRRISAGAQVTPADFVMQHPPKYAGLPLRADIAKIMAELEPPKPDTEIANLADMLAAAQQHYKFAPSLVAEREFKRRYAVEALALGLTRDQVVRIYAFETGGRGTFDMQAGINPDTKAGKVISTAMGYAQLLAANSIDELVRYGEGFISRLSMEAARRETPPERARELTAKIDALRAMLRVGRSVPREWSRHVELARSSPGYGIHVLNLDADIGPWLQVIKLKGIKDLAEQHGRTQLSPAELEIMNLAGPRTGLEMMEPAGSAAPTANFFAQGAYYRNTIVREKTAGELLAAIEGRMNENSLRPGSVEFAAVFDEVLGRQSQGQPQFNDRRNLLPAAAVRAVSAPRAPVPIPVYLAPVAVVPPQPAPSPSRASRPQSAEPTPRLQWAPPRFADGPARPVGFPE